MPAVTEAEGSIRYVMLTPPERDWTSLVELEEHAGGLSALGEIELEESRTPIRRHAQHGPFAVSGMPLDEYEATSLTVEPTTETELMRL